MSEVDYATLPADLKQKLAEIEARSPKVKQMENMQNLVKLTGLVIDGLNQIARADADSTTQTLEALKGVQNDLKALNKEAPKLPDYSKPIVDSLKRLETNLSMAIKKIDVRPEVAAPKVTVDAPAVDLTGVEKTVKELSTSFKEAIALIPKPELNVPETDLSGVEERLTTMLDWLESIDHASRMKAVFPNSMKVTNLDGSTVGATAQYATKITASGTDTYIGEALPGSLQSSAAWRIQKVDTNGNITWKDGDANFDNTATDLTTGVFA